jgi:putative NADPH-quinone reductase
MPPDGSPWPSLGNLKKIAAVCTYGASRLSTAILGDPPKRVVKRMIRLMPGHIVSCQYIAHYGMDHTTAKRRAAFLAKVRKSFEAW